MEKLEQSKYTPKENLSKAEKDKMEKKEQETEEVFKLRSYLAMLLNEYRKDDNFREIFEKTKEDGKKGGKKSLKERMDRLLELQQSGELKEAIGEDDLDEMEDALRAIYQQSGRGKKGGGGEVEKMKDEYGEKMEHVAEKDLIVDELVDVHKQLIQKSGYLEDEELKNFYKFRVAEYGAGMREIFVRRTILDVIRDRIEKAKNEGDGKKVRKLEEKYNQKYKEYEEFAESSPEAFMSIAVENLREAKNTLDAGGRIVETPYVKAKMERVEELIKEGHPVFIHGELGTGKTELAKLLSKKELSKLHLERWEQEHPKPEDPAKQKTWEKERSRESEALIISGHRGLDIDQILGGIMLKRGKSLSPEEQVENINQALAVLEAKKGMPLSESEKDRYREYIRIKFIEEVEDEGGMSEEKIEQWKAENLEKYEEELKEFEERALEIYESKYHGSESIDQDVKTLKEAYREYYKNPVQTEVYLAPFYRAMKEGRPLIIDEMNAIPHHVLIILNDLLTKQYDSDNPENNIIKPMVNDADPIEIKEGFCVIATGNWRPEDQEKYQHRQLIDAAFLSRFALVDYDYLPNDVHTNRASLETYEDIESEREARQANELYRMMVVRLLDDNLGAKLPKGALDKIFDLARVARGLQDVFAGKLDESGYFNAPGGIEEIPEDSDPREILKENVLSLRHLVPILEKWKKDGFVRPLDDYLFLDYVSRSSARPEEQAYIYAILKEKGSLFQDKKKWPSDYNKIHTKKIDEEFHNFKGVLEEIKPVESENMKYEIYSAKDIVEELYGLLPERKQYGEKLFEMSDVEFEKLVGDLMETIEPFFDASYRQELFASFEDWTNFRNEMKKFIKPLKRPEKLENEEKKKLVSGWIDLLVDVAENSGKITKQQADAAKGMDVKERAGFVKDLFRQK